MDLPTLSRLAFQHTKNAVAEELYLRTGRDLTRPVTFYGLVNERCNVRCRYCDWWRRKEYVDEMSIEQWQQALRSIRDFVGAYSISLSGGEPFLKKGFVDLLEWCHANGIKAGVTTNGSALQEKIARRVVAARPLNVNVSVDAPIAAVHDELRGWPGLFDTLSDGIANLVAERRAQRVDFPIIVKPTVNAKNYELLPDLVRWAQKIGATAVNVQPVDRWTPETYADLWIEASEHPHLAAVADELITMKRHGAPILNTEQTLRLLVAHFREEKAPPEVLPCRVGLRDFFIRTNGDVELCFHYPVVGNVKTQSAREIWYGEKAREVRRQTVVCEKLCLFTCLSQKTLRDKIGMGRRLLAQRRR